MRPASILIGAVLVLAGAVPALAQGAAPGALPPGDGRELLATACAQCHNLNVIRAMREGPEGWKKHVHNMVTRGAQLNAREADTVITYLTTNFGPTLAPAPTSAKVSLPAGPGKDLVETRCAACHDLERVAVVKRHNSEWPALVANMVGRGAVASPEEAQAITAYLTANFGGE